MPAATRPGRIGMNEVLPYLLKTPNWAVTLLACVAMWAAFATHSPGCIQSRFVHLTFLAALSLTTLLVGARTAIAGTSRSRLGRAYEIGCRAFLHGGSVLVISLCMSISYCGS